MLVPSENSPRGAGRCVKQPFGVNIERARDLYQLGQTRAHIFRCLATLNLLRLQPNRLGKTGLSHAGGNSRLNQDTRQRVERISLGKSDFTFLEQLVVRDFGFNLGDLALQAVYLKFPNPFFAFRKRFRDFQCVLEFG